MTEVLHWIGSNVVGLVAGIGVAVALKFASKQIPKIVAKFVGDKLSDGFKKMSLLSDSTLRNAYLQVAVDIVKLVEILIPDTKAGKKKYALAAKKICQLVPYLKGKDAQVSYIIEQAVTAMKSELEKKDTLEEIKADKKK